MYIFNFTREITSIREGKNLNTWIINSISSSYISNIAFPGFSKFSTPFAARECTR